MRPTIILALAAVACDNEYKFDDSGGDWDDGGEDEEPVVTSECYAQTAAQAQNVYDTDTGTPWFDDDWETCMTRNAWSSAIDGVDTYIIAAEVHGYDDVVPPEDVNVYMLLRPEDEFDLAVWPDDARYLNPKPALESSLGSALDWGVLWHSEIDTEADWAAWNECYPDCGWWTGVEVYDSYIAGLDSCEEVYDDNSDDTTIDEGMEVCLSFAFGTYPPPIEPPVECESGSGRFQLVPTYWQDWNGDGLRTVQWKPVQETGRTALTTFATVTSIKLVDDQDVPVRVIHKDQRYEFDTNDKLDVSTRGHTVLSDRRIKTFSRSQLRGDLQFVSEDVPKGKSKMEATIVWTCPLEAARTPPPEERTLPQGYVVSLDDLGCGYKQKVVVRPVLYGEQTGYATVELFGRPKDRITVDLRFEDRWLFNVRKRQFAVEGSFIVEEDTLDVEVDRLTYKGIDPCDVGHYVFPKEE